MRAKTRSFDNYSGFLKCRSSKGMFIKSQNENMTSLLNNDVSIKVPGQILKENYNHCKYLLNNL